MMNDIGSVLPQGRQEFRVGETAFGYFREQLLKNLKNGSVSRSM